MSLTLTARRRVTSFVYGLQFAIVFLSFNIFQSSSGWARSACDSFEDGPNWEALVSKENCPRLSQYHLFANPRDPRDSVIGGLPYDLTTPLFSDYANKYRFVFVPPGQHVTYSRDSVFNFPIGSVIAKTFAVGEPGSPQEKILETRLLIHRDSGWVALVYVWRADSSEADLTLNGHKQDVRFVYEGKLRHLQWSVPNSSLCIRCHTTLNGPAPIGLRADLLNRELDYQWTRSNQIDYWSWVGLLKNAPDHRFAPRLPVWNDPKDGSIAERARAYMQVNCAHCHSAEGVARNTGLYLGVDTTSEHALGICKKPISSGVGTGGHEFVIVPGKASQSILTYRMTTQNPRIKMPEVAHELVHDEGLELVQDWVNSLRGRCK